MLILQMHVMQGTKLMQARDTTDCARAERERASMSRASKRRSSYDILHGIAGPASSLPLPKRMEEEAGMSPAKRGTSPTRSLSRRWSLQVDWGEG